MMGDTEDNLAELSIEGNDEDIESTVTIRAKISRHSNSAGEEKDNISDNNNNDHKNNTVKDIEIGTNVNSTETEYGIFLSAFIKIKVKKIIIIISDIIF